MRQVINTPTPITFVSLKEASPEKFYGLQYNKTARAMLSQKNFKMNKYYWFGINALNYGNNAYSVYDSFQSAIENTIHNSEATIFEFDTARELLFWAAESKED